MRNIVIRADRQALIIEFDGLLAIGRQLGFVEIVAEGAIAILLFLILNLFAGGQRLQFFALAADLDLLLAKLLSLFLEDLSQAPRLRQRSRYQP